MWPPQTAQRGGQPLEITAHREKESTLVPGSTALDKPQISYLLPLSLSDDLRGRLGQILKLSYRAPLGRSLSGIEGPTAGTTTAFASQKTRRPGGFERCSNADVADTKIVSHQRY